VKSIELSSGNVPRIILGIPYQDEYGLQILNVNNNLRIFLHDVNLHLQFKILKINNVSTPSKLNETYLRIELLASQTAHCHKDRTNIPGSDTQYFNWFICLNRCTVRIGIGSLLEKEVQKIDGRARRPHSHHTMSLHKLLYFGLHLLSWCN
jgi:hypothetical protein